MIDALPLLLGPEGYQISRSVRLRSSASAYFNRTPASAGNRKTWTWSGWVKRGALNSSGVVAYPLFAVPTGTTDSTWFELRFVSDFLYVGGYSTNWRVTSQVFRDPSAWYHIVLSVDTTQATANDRLKLYVNGTQVTTFSTTNNPTQNADLGINQASATYIGLSNSQYFDGYLTEINFIDGYPTGVTQGTWAAFWGTTCPLFGETNPVTGVWQPKKYTGTYGTNGFYLNFSDNSAATAAAIGKDYSGNGNNWTPNNISVTAGATYDSMLDVPTQWADGGNGRGNYATLNPVANPSTLLNANLTTNAGDKFSISTIGMTTGKWYCEVTVTTVGAESSVGISTQPYSGSNPYVGGTSTSWGYYSNNGNKYTNASNAAYGATYTTGDVIGIAFDADNGTLEFFKNNTSQGTAYTGLTSGPYFFAVEGRTTTSANNCSINFGQRPFAYTPPSGFKALNTLNLPTPTILKGNQYFDATTYTGTGAAQSIVNSGAMQPDFVWFKRRSAAENHWLTDSVRGSTKGLFSNLTDAEATRTDQLTSFNSNGFSLGADAAGYTNVNGQTYIGWQWKEGATQGFDIVTYTGDGTSARAISHSLGVAPRMVIVKARSIGTENWNCWHTSLNNTAARILLNTTGAVDTGSPTVWGTGGINPTSTTFQVGSASATNGNGTTYVAYVFAAVAGYSAFGSYTGNGTTTGDGPFVFCGFRPRYVMLKNITTAGTAWYVYDSARNTYNQMGVELYPNTSGAEVSRVALDFLSNGFKIRSTASGWDNNANGNTIIFAAFSEHPFKNALAR